MTTYFDLTKLKALIASQRGRALKQLEGLSESKHPSAFVAARIYDKAIEPLQLAIADEFNAESDTRHVMHGLAVLVSAAMVTVLKSLDIEEETELQALDAFIDLFARTYAIHRVSPMTEYLRAEPVGNA